MKTWSISILVQIQTNYLFNGHGWQLEELNRVKSPGTKLETN